MAGLIDSYKKVYENKKIHVWIFLLVFVWLLLSFLFDNAIGKPDSIKQNPVDLVFNLLVGIYSIQFLHSAILKNSSLPSFKDINWKALLGVICLNIVWGFYLVIMLVLVAASYFIMHSVVLPAILLLFVLFISIFIYYIYLAFAEDFNYKGLLNIKLIFDFIKPATKETYIKFGQFFLITVAFVVVYLILYILLSLLGLDRVVHIAGDYYLLDMIMTSIVGYFVVTCWFFIFPYSLISTYIEKIRPLLRKGIIDGENV